MDFISKNHHLLEKIFTSCKTPVLFQCRLVCRLWAKEVTRILKKRGVTIAFRSSEDIESFLEVNRPVFLTYTNFLVDIPSPQSPEAVVEQVPSQVVDLLDCYKDDLLELKFWYQPIIQQSLMVGEVGDDVGNTTEATEEVTLKRLYTLHLLSNYVHPTNITGGGQQQAQHQMPSYFIHLRTPNLRSLSIQHLYDTECAPTVVNLLKCSINSLEYFKIPAKPFPVVAMRSESLLLNLRVLDLFGIFNGFSCATNDTLEAIMRHCPKLEKLGIEFSFRATLDKIQQMLGVLASSLVEFRCTIQDRNLLARQIIRRDFILPEMAKLKVLQMRWSNPGLVYYIDRLPCLEELMMDTVWTRKVQGSIFPSGAVFQEGMGQYGKLTCLKLTEVVNKEQVEVFSKYFPSLNVLGCSFASNEALREVYEKMRGLRWLIIERKSNVTEAGGLYGVEDEEEMAKQTPDDEKDNNMWEELNATVQRNVSYIGNLKNLEKLELCQLGISRWSLLYGVADLRNIKTLVVQSKAFRKSLTGIPPYSTSNAHNSLVTFLASRLSQLRNLTLWIRHSADRPSPEETSFIQQTMYKLDELNVVNHSLCGI